MKNSTFFRFFNAFQYFNILLFLFIIGFVFSSTLSGDEKIKESLRPLKYSQSCNEFCENVICQSIRECNDGIILKNETFCNCCEACVKFLDIGDPCTYVISGVLALGPQRRCKKGTTCENGKCQLITEEKSCLRDRDIKMKHNATGKYASEIWIPQCDEEGYYTAKQKKITKSVCFDKSGSKIFGSADDLLEKSCACSRLMQEKLKKDPILFQVKPQEHCSSSGSFDTLQCIGNLCYCADMNTGDVQSELVRRDFLHNLPCFHIKMHRKDYMKDCERELQRTRKLVYEFWKKGVQIYGIDIVKCDPDGTFSPTQCLPDRCVCTDKEGIGIRQYYAELMETLIMTCTCARDEKAAPFMPFSCETNGSYKSFTCFGSKCVCVDEDGDIISEISEKKSCDKLIENLTEYPKTDEDTNSSESDDY